MRIVSPTVRSQIASASFRTISFEGLVPTCWLVGARDGCGGVNMSLCARWVRAPFCVPAVGFEDCYGCISSRSMICAGSPQDRPRFVRPPARKMVLGPGDRCVQGRGCCQQRRAPEKGTLSLELEPFAAAAAGRCHCVSKVRHSRRPVPPGSSLLPRGRCFWARGQVCAGSGLQGRDRSVQGRGCRGYATGPMRLQEL